MLIVYGVLFIIVENRNEGRKPTVRRISELDIKMLLWIGAFQMLALIPGTSRSGATIVGALIIGVSREVAAEFTFFLAIPVMFGSKCTEAYQIRIPLYSSRIRIPDAWLCSFFWNVCYCD